MVYAIDRGANVALSTNKAAFHHTADAAALLGLDVAVSGVLAGGGWYTTAGVTVTGKPGVTFETSVDGQPYQVYTGTIAVAGAGVHSVSVRGSDGSTGGVIVPIDATPPSVAITVPTNNSTLLKNQPVLASFSCADAGSGVASCAGSFANGSAIDTSVPGAKSFQVVATDVAGNAVTLTQPYAVSTCAWGNTACDGIPDSYKLQQACFQQYPLSQDISQLDTDGDGLTNIQEFGLGTNPCKADTDGDGYTDGQEVAIGKNPLVFCGIMRADVTHDGQVSIIDIAAVAQHFWQTVPPAPAIDDMHRDGVINALDLSFMARWFGQSVTQCP